MASRPSSDLQEAILGLLWVDGESSAGQLTVRMGLSGRKRPTIRAALRSLEREGLVSSRPDANGLTLFRATITAQDYRDGFLRDVLHRLFSGSPCRLIKHLLETEGFTIAELQSIRATLDRQQQRVNRA